MSPQGRKTGLFFGSFNPVHHGHLMIANYLAEYTDLSEIWFIVSPHNPLKKKQGLAHEADRLEMLYLAVGDDKRFRVSDIELRLPKPSYTIHTLTHLSEKFPEREFVLIIGGDNLESFQKWRNPEVILQYYQLYVYARPGFSGGVYGNHPSVKIIEAPLMEISSSLIRESLKQGKDLSWFVPSRVWEYILKYRLYI